MAKIIIETDGTADNTKISVDGKDIKNLTSIGLYASLGKCWCDANPCWCRSVEASYTTKKQVKEKGLDVTVRTSLSKVDASLKEEIVADVSRPSFNDFKNM